MPLPPGPRAPAAWQTAQWVLRPDRFLEACAARYGDPFTIRVLWADGPMVLTADPDAIAQIFRDASQPDGALCAGATSAVLEPFAGPRSILLLSGEEHLAERRAMLPAFHGDALRGWREEIASIAREHVARWPQSVRAHELLADLTLDVIARVVFGARDGDGPRRLRAAVRRALAMTHRAPTLLAMSLGFDARFRRAVADVDRELYTLIDEIEPGPDSVLALLKATADDPRHLRDQLVTLLAAGHETTATALAWALERLARAPEIAVWARGDGERLGAVADETLRLRPVLSIAARRTVAPYELRRHVLPAGVGVSACLLLAMRDPRVWGPDALEFRPGRAVPDGAYVPWGGGTRRCLGAAFARMEMVEVLRAVLDRADLAPDRAAPERARRRSVTIGPARGARVVLRPR